MSTCIRTHAAFVLLIGLTGAIPSCHRGTVSKDGNDGRLNVFVSIPPQKTFVERVGGDRVAVSVLLAPGQSPATYDPTAKDIVRLSAADVYFRIGVPFEKQVVGKIDESIQGLRIVDTRAGLPTRSGDPHHDCRHAPAEGAASSQATTSDTSLGEGPAGHGDHDHHHQHDLDPHVWMDPHLVKRQVETIRRALTDLDPDGQAEYESNAERFTEELDAVDAEIRERLRPVRGGEFYVFHPCLGYFADAYGLRQQAIEVGGKSPTAKQLSRLIDRAKRDGVQLIFVQPQFDRRCAEVVAREIGGAVVPLDPLAEDYIQNLKHIAKSIRHALDQRPTTSAP